MKYALEIMAHDFQSLLSALCGHCQRGVLIPFLCSEMSVKIIPATPFSISIIIASITICRNKLVSGVHIYILLLLLQNRIMVVCEVRRKEVKMFLLF